VGGMVKININEQGRGVKKWEFWTKVLFECPPWSNVPKNCSIHQESTELNNHHNKNICKVLFCPFVCELYL